jgi:hypothetical protein
MPETVAHKAMTVAESMLGAKSKKDGEYNRAEPYRGK